MSECQTCGSDWERTYEIEMALYKASERIGRTLLRCTEHDTRLSKTALRDALDMLDEARDRMALANEWAFAPVSPSWLTSKWQGDDG